MINKVMIDNKLHQVEIKEILLDNVEQIDIMELKNRENIISELVSNEISVCVLDISSKKDLCIIEEIKENSLVMDIPIIVYSKNFDTEIMEQALKLGAYEYLDLKNEISKKIFCLKVKNAIEHIKRYKEIIFLSYHDELTGLYNKRFFEEEIKRLDTKRQLPISIIVGDINGLKLTNDVFGHHMGDKILSGISNIIKESCRKEDIIARWGGDEFYILLPKTTRELANDICHRINNACSQNKVNNIPLSISLGYYTKEDVNESLPYIVNKAEKWMYKHKLIESKNCLQEILDSFKETIIDMYPQFYSNIEEILEMSKKIGHKFNLSSEEQETLELLVLFQDIGYIIIEDDIINKKEKLSKNDWDMIKKHSDIGYRIAKASPELNIIADYILYHHERWDGKGYPNGIKGEKIPKLSRILTIMNAYDAMTHPRPYRQTLTQEEAIRELVEGAGTQFDPSLIQTFVSSLSMAETR